MQVEWRCKNCEMHGAVEVLGPWLGIYARLVTDHFLRSRPCPMPDLSYTEETGRLERWESENIPPTKFPLTNPDDPLD